MDEIKISEEEHKDRVKFLNICERLARKYANKYCKDDHQKIVFVQELAITFLGNMTFRFFSEYATKNDCLSVIYTVNKSLQQWYTHALNEIDFNKPRTNLQ